MNNPIALDGNGHIIINDSMSDDLKEKIALYNQMGDTEVLEDDVDNIQVSENDIEMSDDYGMTEEGSELTESSTVVTEEELNDLNDLFN